jgi:HAE1 family hydrophobic/amphiphilic exporter-1
VLISLFVAFTLVPMLASRHGAPEEDPAKLDPKTARGWWRQWLKVRRVLAVWNRAFDAFKPVYTRMLAYSLRHRVQISLLATAAFALGMYMAGTLPQEWMPAQDQGKLFVSVETPPGTTLDETSERIAEMEDIINKLPEAVGTYVTIGSGNNEVTEGNLLVILKDASERDISAQRLVDSVRNLLRVVPGVKTALATQQAEGGSSKPIELSIRGDNRDDLARLTHEVQAIMDETPGTADVDNTLQEGKPELQVHVDRDAADDLGLNIYGISQTVRTLVEGEEVTRFKEGDKEHEVRLRLQKRFRASDHDIERILVHSSKDVVGKDEFLVPLGRVAQIESRNSIGELLRYDRQPEVRVNSNVLQGFASGTIAQEAVARARDELKFPPGYSVQPVGEEEIREESSFHILRALVLAVVFIYLVLASQYESFHDPLSIMLSLPLSLIGAFLALGLTGGSMNITSQIGIVMLMGIVTKNAILLVDFIKQRRNEGLNRSDAVLEAGPIRLRPILMTTFATVFGMLPLALGIGPGAEMRAPMARAVIGGMISSTMLTLIVVPVVYTIIDDFVGLFRRKKKKEDGRPVPVTGMAANADLITQKSKGSSQS